MTFADLRNFSTLQRIESFSDSSVNDSIFEPPKWKLKLTPTKMVTPRLIGRASDMKTKSLLPLFANISKLGPSEQPLIKSRMIAKNLAGNSFGRIFIEIILLQVFWLTSHIHRAAANRHQNTTAVAVEWACYGPSCLNMNIN
jgi:hypothetical protein